MVSSTIFTMILACIIAIIATDINRKKTNVETATTEKAETMQEQEEQNMPKAITTPIVAGTPNANNVTYVDSEELDENLNPKKVPVPKGYVASPDAEERYVNGVTTDGVREHHGGFVIYERLASDAEKTDEQVQQVIDDDLEVAQRTRNQWVWVPIEDVGDMYHQSGNLIYANFYTFNNVNNPYGKNTTSLKEPNLAAKVDSSHRNLKQYMEGISGIEFLHNIREEFADMLKSVATYGGFYIGRYETGNTQKNNLKVVKGQTGTMQWYDPSNNIGSIKWYDAYKRSRALRGTNPVRTGLIWGIQWDETLVWLMKTGEKTPAEVITNSINWGNYYGATFTYIDLNGDTQTKSGEKVIPTGLAERNKANNIYDLAGNMWEWTMCSNSGSYGFSSGAMRAYRGGGVNYSNRDELEVTYEMLTDPGSEAPYIGCRLSLYIQ